jgi:hypothetical protein
MGFARLSYVVRLPFWASAFSSSCLMPRASAGERAQNSRRACRLRSRQVIKSLWVFPALAEEGDDAVGELAEGHRVEGRGVEPIDDERVVAADPFEAFARRAFRGGLGGIEGERRLLDLFADEGVAEVFRPALADGLRFCAFGEHEEGHIRPAAGLVEDLAVGRLVVDPDRLEGREFVPAGHARDREPLPAGVLPDPDRATDEAGRIGLGFERSRGL